MDKRQLNRQKVQKPQTTFPDISRQTGSLEFIAYTAKNAKGKRGILYFIEKRDAILSFYIYFILVTRFSHSTTKFEIDDDVVVVALCFFCREFWEFVANVGNCLDVVDVGNVVVDVGNVVMSGMSGM
jgi:hypothetical protein